MSQRINITYSIKFEELETEVKRLLTSAMDKLEEVFDDSNLEDRDALLDMETFKDIDDLRQGLTEVDVALSDVNNLIASYLDYEVQRLSPNRKPDMPAAAPMENPLANLNDKLAYFKEWSRSQTEDQAPPNEVPD